ncbi:GNAT family N-acetyltransferase [Nocardiopsis potens]|uniref:GNAT family N-acetyltransferase n=1 Tax=Nocardiopsis potens TaxID=1246458 RepID=UPI0003465C3F|nr:GNAT family N-acetyltransferase [Nocardiopsis potens]
MALWRIRTPVEDRPGRLAGLVGAMAAEGADIVALTIHTDASGAVDEFVADVPGDPERLRRAVAERAGGGEVLAVPARPREVGDETTRALLLTARLRSAPNRLPEALAELLRAEEAHWTDPSVPGPGAGEADTLLVPVGPLRAVRVHRPGRPFTWTESARADALVRSVLPATGPPVSHHRPQRRPFGPRVLSPPTEGVLVTAGGDRLRLSQVGAGDADAVRRLHARCSAETRRRRYLSSVAEPGARMLRVFCDPERGLTVAARPEGEDEPVALAHLMYTLNPGVGEMAFLVEDSWQGRGVGAALADAVAATAADWGLAEVRAETAAENRAMLRIVHRMGAAVGRPEAGAVQARVPLAGRAPAAPPGRLTALMTRPGAAGR